ncbi:HNH endonuclease signature motif containing protein [Companilactobacillus metriopterae]|uniref:HNH endonuclease signature motif containing protein n=1 Tax=Companilactobacillus metriopterae TaxID=1909267 RepID=UPI001F50898B|nr:HNH endonuclease signature motif containing protein [Companilactobacillus metriopterae]
MDTCIRCGMKGQLGDHIIPSEDDWENRLNINNLETLCNDCHRLKTKREWIKKHKGVKRSMKITIVSGYPASGKHSYVSSRITEHDLVYDYDELMKCSTGQRLIDKQIDLNESNETTESNKSLINNIDVKEYIDLIYEMILRKLRTEKTFNNVWIIQSIPDIKLFDLLASYDADYILLDGR